VKLIANDAGAVMMCPISGCGGVYLRISRHRDQAFRGIVIARFAHVDRLFRAW
jgi:hypothetical protein